MCLLSQQNPAASSLEGAIWRGPGTQSRTLDAILHHPQQSHLVGSTALGLTLPLLYSRKSEPRGWKDHLGDGEWQAVGDDESILALEITLNPLPIVQGFEIAQSSGFYQNTPLTENTLEASLYAKLKFAALYVHTFILFSRLILALPNPLPW